MRMWWWDNLIILFNLYFIFTHSLSISHLIQSHPKICQQSKKKKKKDGYVESISDWLVFWLGWPPASSFILLFTETGNIFQHFKFSAICWGVGTFYGISQKKKNSLCTFKDFFKDFLKTLSTFMLKVHKAPLSTFMLLSTEKFISRLHLCQPDLLLMFSLNWAPVPIKLASVFVFKT